MGAPVTDKLKLPAALWEGLRRAGVDRVNVARRAKLPLGALKDDLPVSTKQFFSVWRAIEAVSADAVCPATTIAVKRIPSSRSTAMA